jgi:glycosyltransferase involved in cell wall biosynthesis
MFCTTIIPTINRATLPRTVQCILDQTLDPSELEVIVVNDTGKDLPDADWLHCERVRVVTTYRHERSVARNTGAALARGKFLHFLDDDDLIVPGAMKAFYDLDRSTGAAWLYGSYQTVDNEGKLIFEHHPEISGDIFPLLVVGESIPLQASIVSSKQFHEIGGFDSNPKIIGVEDRDMGRRMAMSCLIAYTPEVVAKIRIGETGSSTNWSTINESDRLGREKALNLQNAYPRLRSATQSHYWHGRVFRALLGSASWNMKHGRPLTAFSRTLASITFTGLHLFQPGFWQGIHGLES